MILLLPSGAFGQEHRPDTAPEITVAPRCRGLKDMIVWLRESFNEIDVAHGLSTDGELLEVFASQEGTFTAVKITPGGYACIVDMGVGWQMRPRQLDGAALDGRGSY